MLKLHFQINYCSGLGTYFKLEFSQPNYIDFGIQGVLDLRKMAKPMHTPIPRVKSKFWFLKKARYAKLTLVEKTAMQ